MLPVLPVFAATVDEQGELGLDHPVKYRRYLKSLAGQRVMVYLRRPSELRSLNQNRYYHGVVVRVLADHWALTDQQAHELIKKEFGVRSTAVLETAQFEDFLERVRAWALTDHGVTVPMPGEVL
jgi:hypothetical protein